MSTASQIRARLNQDPKFWKRGGMEYSGPAPSEIRAGSDGPSFHVTFDADEFGRWKDFKTDGGGSLYTLAQALGIPLPKRVAGRETLDARSLSDYERDKGLPAGYLAKRGWVEGSHKDRPCLFIPLEDGTRQVRYLDGLKPKFIWEDSQRENDSDGKAKLAFYGSGNAKKLVAAKKLNFMVWTNGAGSVEALQQYGIPAFAVVGGEGHMARKIYVDRVLKSFPGTIFIALDCDKTGREGAAKLQNLLGERGLTLDLGGSDGFDGADFAMLWGEMALSRLIELADKAHDDKPPRTAAEAAAAVMKQILGEKEIRGRFVRNPFSLLHQFGGGAFAFYPNLITGVLGLSGHGKTAFWHSVLMMLMNDPSAWGFMVDSREFTPEVDHVRRLKTVMENNFSYDDIVKHLIALQERRENVPKWARVGEILGDATIEEIAAIHKRFADSWKGTLEYAEEYPFIEDTLDYMKRRTLEIRDAGGNMDIWIFDHLRLYHLKPESQASSADNIYNLIVEKIKDAARAVNVHAIIMIQPNKTPTADALRSNNRLRITDMAFVNEVHFNCILGLNTLYGTQAVWETGLDNVVGGGAWAIAGRDPASGEPLVDKALLSDGSNACIIEVLKNTFGKTGFAPIRGDFANLRWLNQSWDNNDLRLPLDAGF